MGQLMNSSHNALKIFDENAPSILTTAGIVSFLASTGTAIVATTKAVDIFRNYKEEKEKEENVSTAEMVAEIVPLYIPTAITGVAGILCCAYSNKINSARLATLATLYSVTQTRLNNYKNKVVEKIGEKKEALLSAEADGEEMRSKPIKPENNQKEGEMLCYDYISGRYFWFNPENILRIENRLNRRLIDELFVTLNEFYDELDIPHIGIGDMVGWDIDQAGVIEFVREYDYAETGDPCCIITANVSPKHLYYK